MISIIYLLTQMKKQLDINENIAVSYIVGDLVIIIISILILSITAYNITELIYGVAQ